MIDTYGRSYGTTLCLVLSFSATLAVDNILNIIMAKIWSLKGRVGIHHHDYYTLKNYHIIHKMLHHHVFMYMYILADDPQFKHSFTPETE